jgi:hypothetical protein
MKPLQRGQEVIVLAFTGNAASNVGESTIHSGLNLAIGNESQGNPSGRVQYVWANKTIDADY